MRRGKRLQLNRPRKRKKIVQSCDKLALRLKFDQMFIPGSFQDIVGALLQVTGHEAQYLQQRFLHSKEDEGTILNRTL